VTSTFFHLTSHPNPPDAFSIMILVNAHIRRPRTKLPPEHARAEAFDELPRGGGAGRELFEAWRLPPKKVVRGVIVGGLVSQRVCTVCD
jgi:hypothetical protein